MRRVLRRLLLALFLALFLATLAFALIRVAPGGPFDSKRAVGPETIESAIHHHYRLQEPVWTQYLRHLGLLWEWYPHQGWLLAQPGLLHGNFGPSLRHPADEVGRLIREGLIRSIGLTALGLILAAALGIPVGILTALPMRAWRSVGGSLVVLACLSTFIVVVSAMMAARHAGEWDAAVRAWGLSGWPVWVVVGIAGLFFGGRIAYSTRGNLKRVLDCPWVDGARAVGLRESAVLWKHAVPVAMAASIPGLGPLIGAALTGSLLVENILGIRGLGWALVQGAAQGDHPLVVHVAMVYAVMLILLHPVLAWIHYQMDPRVRDA